MARSASKPGMSRTSKTFTRHVAPFAPLALALAMNLGPSRPAGGTPALVDMPVPDSATAVQCPDNIADFQECHDNFPTGCSPSAGYDAYVNALKNLTPSAPSATIAYLDQMAIDNLNTNTPSGLGKTNHADFKDQLTQLGEGNQFGVIGYLYYFQATGAESSNCELTGPDKEGGNVDFHIGIGFDPSLAGQAASNPRKAGLKKQLQQNSVVVEMTPHYRARFHDGIWTLANLKPALGHKVRVVGQLLVDSEHNRPSDNCALEGTTAQKNRCWRYSIWELHPVTRFEYCNDDSCTQNSADWVPLGGQSSATDAGTTPDSNSGQPPSAAHGATRKPRISTRSVAPQSDPTSRP
jgi:hypothetical protein